VSQEFQVDVDKQVLKVPKEYKVNLERLERLISGGGKRPVQILELHWSMKVLIFKMFVFCHIGFFELYLKEQRGLNPHSTQ
jgi:hypothetical protein